MPEYLPESPTFNDLKKYMNQSQQQNLHEQAFMETFNIIEDFVMNGLVYNEPKKNVEKLAWVCNSAMGIGKTTALKVLLKRLADKKTVSPLLLVFNNTDTMNSVYREIHEYAIQNKIQNLIIQITFDNRSEFEEDLKYYKFVCITQQRLRNLALNIGNRLNYLTFSHSQKPLWGQENEYSLKRSIIIDEMPIFFNTCVFDLAIDWFEQLAKDNLDAGEMQIGKPAISMLIALKLLHNRDICNERLYRHIAGSPFENIFKDILNKLSTENGNPDLVLKCRWFKKLFLQDDVGYIDRHNKGSAILCSERIDYRKLGNILILDGTSEYCELLYNNEYDFKKVFNYHDYSRLRLHWREINTSAFARKSNKGTKLAISEDIQKLRTEENIFPFPLMAKDDIKSYIENGVISDEQKKHFRPKETVDDDMPLNLLNTTGKNVLDKADSLALLNLPIRNPQYYKLFAIGLYPRFLDLDMAKDWLQEIGGYDFLGVLKDGDWFADPQINAMFKEIMLADLLQIIHRSSLRKINKKNRVNIYIYANRKEWIGRLKEVLKLPEENVTHQKILNISLYKFAEKCSEWAKKCFDYCTTYNISEPNSVKARTIGGKSFVEWLKNNVNNVEHPEKRGYIERVFGEYGIEIEQAENTYWYVRLISVNY